MKTLCTLITAVMLLALCPAWTTAYVITFSDGRYLQDNDDGPPILLPLDKGKAAFDRAMDPGHVVLTGLGPAKDQTLTLDATTQDQVFAMLGRAERIPDKYPRYPTFGYVSSLPGDSTVLLLTREGWPASDKRVYLAELRSDSAGYEFAKNLHPSPGVNKDIATQSGLRLGLTKDQVKALLGWPLHEDENRLWYGATYDHVFTLDEVLARGCGAKYAGQPAGVYQNIIVAFVGGRASSVWILHRITWE